MADFDPDAYLAEFDASKKKPKTPAPVKDFDPDEYLAEFDPDAYLAGTDISPEVVTEKIKGITGKKQATWKDLLRAIPSGLAQAQAGLYNAIKTAYGVPSAIVDKITPDKLYQPEYDFVLFLLNDIVEKSEGISKEQRKKAGELKGAKDFLFTGIEGATAMAPAVISGGMAAGSLPANYQHIARAVQMFPFGVQAFGGGARQAELDEATKTQQLLHGITIGSGEVLTEMIPMDYFFKAFKLGKQPAEQLIRKGSNTFLQKFGKRGLDWIMGAVTETAQEAVMSPVEAISRRITYDPETKVFDFNDIAKQGMGGLSMSLVMGAVGLPAGSLSRTMVETAIENNENIDIGQLKQVMEDDIQEIVQIKNKEEASAEITLEMPETVDTLKMQEADKKTEVIKPEAGVQETPIPTIESILSRYNSGDENLTEADVISELESIDLPEELEIAIDEYKEAAEEDRDEYGMRSGLPEDAIENVMNIAEKYAIKEKVLDIIPKYAEGASEKQINETWDKVLAQERAVTSKEKRSIEKVTGIKKQAEKITISEDILLHKRIKDEIRGAKEGLKEGKRITREYLINEFRKGEQRREEIINYIKDKIPAEHQGKFITGVNRAKSVKSQFKIFDRADRMAKDIEKSALISEVKSLVKPKGNMALDYKNKVEDIAAKIDIKTPTLQTVSRLRGLNDYIKKNGKPFGISQKSINELDRLARKPLSTMTGDELSQLKVQLEKLKSLGKLKRELKYKYNERERQVALNKLLSSTRNLDPKITGNEKIDKSKFQAMRTYFNTLHTQRVADAIDGYKNYNGENARYIKQLSSIANRTELETQNKSATALEEIQKIKNIWTEKEQGDMVLLLHMEQGAYEQAQSIIDAYGYERIPEKTVEYAKAMDIIRGTVDNYDRISPVYAEIENESLGRVENYFPIKYEKEANVLPSELINQNRYRTTQAFKGFTFGRKSGVQRMPRTDLFNIMEETVREQLWYANMQPALENIKYLVKDEAYIEKAGELASNFWLNELDIVARRGWSATARNNYILKQARLNLNNAILGYKLSTIAMQPFAVFDAIAYAETAYGPDAAALIAQEFLTTWMSPGKAKALVSKSDALKLRQGGELAIEETLSGTKNIYSLYAWIKRAATAGIRFTDLRTAAGVESGFMKILKKHGVKNVQEEADVLMNLVSGSSDVVYRPHILATGEGARTWFTFQTFFMNRWGIIIHDLINSGLINNKSLLSKLRALTGMGVLVAGSIAEEIARKYLYKFVTGKQPKEESMAHTALMALPSQVPYFGNLLEVGFGGYSADPPIIKVMEDTFKGGAKVITGKKPETKIKGGLKATEGLLSLTLGVPGTAQAFDILERAIVPPKKTLKNIKGKIGK